jgi:signal transduction histidine kinase
VRIAQHLKLTLVLLIAAAFAVGLAGLWVRGWIHVKAYQNLEREMGVLLLLSDVEVGILAAQNAEKRYLARYGIDGIEFSERYVSDVLSEIKKTRQALDQIEQLNESAGIYPEHRYREQLESRLSLFELQVKRMVLLIKRKGDYREYPSPTSGLVWEMRRMVEGLERYLARLETEPGPPGKAGSRAAVLQRLKADVLFIRQWEKDYYLRDDLQAMSELRNRITAIEDSISDAPLTGRERDRIVTYLKTYLIYLERIAYNDLSLFEERARLNQTLEDLDDLLNEYVAAERGVLGKAKARIDDWQRQTLMGVLALFTVIFLLSVFLAIRLTRRITGSLDTLVDATEELGERGECPTIQMETQDEFARLAEAFNGMVERLRVTQLQLLQDEKLKATGKLSASIAHEINNPLFGIQGCLERVLKRLPKDDRDRRLVELAVRESQRIARLVQGLRDYHRPTDLTMAPVDLLEILEDVFLINRKYIQQNRVKLVKRLPKSLPRVTGTRDQLQMVFVNLMTNAVEAMPEGGELTISASHEKGSVALNFADTGRGIEADDMQKIFEPFFSTKPEVKGVGLGLSISYGIIRRHEGEIRVKSKPGQTIFSVVLPVLREEGEEAA